MRDEPLQKLQQFPPLMAMKEITEEQAIENYRTTYKVCSKCGKSRRKSSFNMDSTKIDRLQTQCRDCKRKIQKNDYLKKKSIYLERQNKRRMANPDMKRAHDLVRLAINRGDLIRPANCTNCGNSKMRIEAHHHKGYAPENALDVVFLCTSCHRSAED